MADWTKKQLEQMGAVVSGTHDRLDTKGRVQPLSSTADIYRGILPSAKPATGPSPAVKSALLSNMKGRGLPEGFIPNAPNRLDNAAISRLASLSSQNAGMTGRGQPPRLPRLETASLGNDRLRPGFPIELAPDTALAGIDGAFPKPPQPNPSVLMAMMGRGQPVPPPPPVGADPGMGGAMLGNPRMASSIPPQQPPADGSSPLPVWRGEQPTAVATMISRGLTGIAPNGYAYQDGQRVGNANWTQGYTPEQQYKSANLQAQVAAMDRARTATGITPVQQIQRQTGASGAPAYDQANAAAQAAAIAKATKPVYKSSGGGGGGDWFSSVTSA